MLFLCIIIILWEPYYSWCKIILIRYCWQFVKLFRKNSKRCLTVCCVVFVAVIWAFFNETPLRGGLGWHKDNEGEGLSGALVCTNYLPCVWRLDGLTCSVVMLQASVRWSLKLSYRKVWTVYNNWRPWKTPYTGNQSEPIHRLHHYCNSLLCFELLFFTYCLLWYDNRRVVWCLPFIASLCVAISIVIILNNFCTI